MLRHLILAFVLILFSVPPLVAESLTDFLKRLPADSDPTFKAANVRDLSVYQTWSKWQPPLGACSAFSHIAAVEAAYTRKYCGDSNSDFYKAGYCDRYVAYRTADPPKFYLVDHAYAFFESKDLDLSELYYIDRVKTSLTTNASCNHEAGNMFCQEEGITRGLGGTASLMVSAIRLPVEKEAAYIFDGDFYPGVQTELFDSNGCLDGCSDCDSPSQEELDAYSFSERKLDLTEWDNTPLHRAFIPFEGRRSARFGVSDMLVGHSRALPDPIKFLEKCIYSNFEVAVGGATSGHVMLLIGYDRNRQKFLYKDHYHRFVEVDYQTTKDHFGDFDIVIEPYANWTAPSKEEMWIGQWDVWIDGEYGRLVIRRTRLASNVKYTQDEDANNHFPALSTTQWARVGTYYQGTAKRVVYGRLNASGGDTMQLIIDFDHVEPPPPSVEIAGTPAGQLFALRMFSREEGAAAYASGYTTIADTPYAVLMKRPEQNPYGLIPMTPSSSFDKLKWSGRFNIRRDGADEATLTLTTDGVSSISGTYQAASGNLITLGGQFVQDHHVKLTGYVSGVTVTIHLYFHRQDDRLVDGDYQIGGSTSALFGTRVSGESGLFHARYFFPYYDLGANMFNGIGVANFSEQMGVLKYTAFTKTGDEAAVPKNPTIRYLSAGDQTALQATEIFGGNPGSPDSPCWVDLYSNTADIGTLSLFGDGAQHIDGAVAWSAVAKEMYLTRIYHGEHVFDSRQARTIVAIANPTDTPAAVDCDLIGNSGETLGFSRRYAIGPQRILQRSIHEFYTQPIPPLYGAYLRIRVVSGEGVIAAGVVRLPLEGTSFGLNALVPSSGQTLYSAQIAKVPGLFTLLRLINTGSVNRTVTIRGLTDGGANYGTPSTVHLVAGEVYTAGVHVFLQMPASAQVIGSLRVEADGPGIIGDVVFGDDNDGKYVAALALQDQPFKKAVFSQVAEGMGYFTGLAIYNPHSGPATITVKVYTNKGVLAGQKIKTLQPNQRLSQMVSELVPASASQIGGYIVIESDQGVVAQEMFGGLNGEFLSAVPPTVVK